MIKNKSILLVDDDLELVSILKSLLEDDGYNILTAYSGNQALNILKKNIGKIQVVLTDVKMPDGDGITLLKKTRELDPRMPHIILHTGFSEITKQEAIELGAIDLLQKPVEFEFIEKYLASLFKEDEKYINQSCAE